MAKRAPFQEERRPIGSFGDSMALMVRAFGENVHIAPLLVRRFRLIAPHRLKDAQLFAGKYRDYQQLTAVPDKLRWLRYCKGFLQSEVAEVIGVTRAVYGDMERGITQQIPLDATIKLAQLYQVPVAELMDEYNRFLYDGQATRIRAYRESLGLKRKAFAKAVGIPIRSLQEWESGKKTVSRKSWERYFKGRA